MQKLNLKPELFKVVGDPVIDATLTKQFQVYRSLSAQGDGLPIILMYNEIPIAALQKRVRRSGNEIPSSSMIGQAMLLERPSKVKKDKKKIPAQPQPPGGIDLPAQGKPYGGVDLPAQGKPSSMPPPMSFEKLTNRQEAKDFLRQRWAAKDCDEIEINHLEVCADTSRHSYAFLSTKRYSHDVILHFAFCNSTCRILLLPTSSCRLLLRRSGAIPKP
jgi:hypothetical protein